MVDGVHPTAVALPLYCKAATSCLSDKKHRKKAEEQGRKERKNTHKRTSCELPPFAPFRFFRRPEFRLRPKAAPSPSATFAVTIAAFAGMASRGVSASPLRVPSWTSWFHDKTSGGRSPPYTAEDSVSRRDAGTLGWRGSCHLVVSAAPP